jgi:CRP-like cAMP-binding protein
MLTRSLGTNAHVEVDTTFVQVEPGDRFVLCSDGLHRYLGGAEVREASSQSAGATDLVERLIREAKARGGRDNVTVVCVEAAGDGGGASLALRQEIELLQGTFLFAGLTEQEVVRVMRILYADRWRAGETIIREGEPGRELYIVAEGEVDVTLRGAHLSTVGAGGHFGELALIDNEVRSATVTARTNVTLLRVEQSAFSDLLHADDQLGRKLLWRFLRSVTAHLRALSREVASLEGVVGTYNKPTVVDLALPTGFGAGPGRE